MDRSISTTSRTPKQHLIPADAEGEDKLFRLKSDGAYHLPKDHHLGNIKHSVKYLPLSSLQSPLPKFPDYTPYNPTSPFHTPPNTNFRTK
jgi:hypothetical protein